MALFRSVTVGLLGACLYFVVQLAGTGAAPAQDDDARCPRMIAEALQLTVETARDRQQQVTVVDVAHGVAPTTISSLLQLAADERISAVDDREVTSNVEAGALLATQLLDARLQERRFVDLTIATARADHPRRVLVLLH